VIIILQFIREEVTHSRFYYNKYDTNQCKASLTPSGVSLRSALAEPRPYRGHRVLEPSK